MTRASALLISLLALLALAAPAGAALKSSNVQVLGNHREAVGAIGARFTPDGDTMFLTSMTNGLLVYDVSDARKPRRVSQIPLAHIENEDVDAGHVAGKDIVIISDDPSFRLGAYGALYVFDVTDPARPTLLSATPTRLPATGGIRDRTDFASARSNNGHIANCVQRCRWVWTTGSEHGVTVYDFADPAKPKMVGSFAMPAPKNRDSAGFTHDVFVDRAGIAWITGEDGTFGYDTNGYVPTPVAGQPFTVTAPPLRYRSDENVVNSGQSGDHDLLDDEGVGSTEDEKAAANAGPLDFLHHNSMRTGLRVSGRKTKRAKAGLGNVVAVTEEDYTRPGCKGQGSLQTWQISDELNSDGTQKLRLLDQWTTELNELRELKGRSDEQIPATANCSAHWFDESNGLLAQGWYDQGIRFMDISNPRDIRQVGYYVTQGEYWAAYFAPSDPKRQVVYALDTAGGLDVLALDRNGARLGARSRRVKAPVSRRAVTRRSKLEPTARWGFACPLVPGAR
jgi:hypothetical protein